MEGRRHWERRRFDGFTISHRSSPSRPLEGGRHDGFSRSTRKVFRVPSFGPVSHRVPRQSTQNDGWVTVNRRKWRPQPRAPRRSLNQSKDLRSERRSNYGSRPSKRLSSRCFRCGGRDHIASGFRDPLICFSCNRTGHKSFDCKKNKERKMVGWRSDFGLSITEDMRRRVEALRSYGVVSVLTGSCKPWDVAAIVRRRPSDRNWNFECTRLKDLSHFLVRCRSEDALDDLCSVGAFGEEDVLLKIEPWTMKWGCSQRLGSGDPRWIKVTGLPIHAWSILMVQEIFDMEGKVMDLQPNVSLNRDHVIASVLFDAHDWNTLPAWIGKRIGTSFFKIFIRKGDAGPQSFRPQGIQHLTWDASSADQGAGGHAPGLIIQEPEASGGRTSHPSQGSVGVVHASTSQDVVVSRERSIQIPQGTVTNSGTLKWLEKGKWPVGAQPSIPSHVLFAPPAISSPAVSQPGTLAGSLPVPTEMAETVDVTIRAEDSADIFPPNSKLLEGEDMAAVIANFEFEFENSKFNSSQGRHIGSNLDPLSESEMSGSEGNSFLGSTITPVTHVSDIVVADNVVSMMEVDVNQQQLVQAEDSSLIITGEKKADADRPSKRSARLQSKKELDDRLKKMAELNQGLADLCDEEMESLAKSWAFKEFDDTETLQEILSKIKSAMKKK